MNFSFFSFSFFYLELINQLVNLLINFFSLSFFLFFLKGGLDVGWERQNMPRVFGISTRVILLYNAYQIIANEHVLTLRKDCMIHLATKYHHYSVIPPHLLMMEHHSLPRLISYGDQYLDNTNQRAEGSWRLQFNAARLF